MDSISLFPYADGVANFFAFIEERHAIYLRRKRGDEWPWTEDEILQSYKFTNIFRELDNGTIHCRTAIREPYRDHPELFFNVASYRLYNYIDTQNELGFIEHYDKDKVMEIMYARRERGERIFTGAHMITGTLGGDKIHQVFGLCLGTLWEKRKELEPHPGDTLEQAFHRLNKHCPGYGPFISYEAITDLRHTRYLNKAKDIMTWANPGPGAQRGINRILGNPIKSHKKEDWGKKIDTSNYPSRGQCIVFMRQLLRIANDTKGGEFFCERTLPPWIPKMEMRDIEHSLCEFDKYERVRLGEGKPRSRYTPPHLRR